MVESKRAVLQEVKQEARDPGNPGYVSRQLEPERKRKPHPRGRCWVYGGPRDETGSRYKEKPKGSFDNSMRFHFNEINRSPRMVAHSDELCTPSH